MIVIQLIPLPPFIFKFVSPHTFEIKKNVYELSNVPGDSANAWMNLSLYNFATCNELTRLLTYTALYFMIVNTVRDRKRIKILIYVLIIMELFQVLYGVAQTYSSSQKIWWWTNDYGRGWVTGTYINRNHLAGFLEMVIPLCMGFMIANLKRRKPKVIKNWVSSGEERSKIILLFSMGLPLGLGFLLTGSRGGIISFGICMFFMALVVYLTKTIKLGLFRRSLEIDRRYWKKAIEMVWKYYPDERIVMAIIPEGDKDLGGRVKKWLGPRK